MSTSPQRPVLPSLRIAPTVHEVMAKHFASTIAEVEQAIARSPIVVVGMAQNPYPRKARKLLDSAGVRYEYLEYGSYFSGWRKRNAIKMWAGWPTMPLVFVKGVLMGGADDLQRVIASGEFQKQLSSGAS
jgi:monothiol glutaredoxin